MTLQYLLAKASGLQNTDQNAWTFSVQDAAPESPQWSAYLCVESAVISIRLSAAYIGTSTLQSDTDENVHMNTTLSEYVSEISHSYPNKLFMIFRIAVYISKKYQK